MVDKDEQDYDINLERVLELISKYEQIKNSGEIKRYNEESTKKDFILPLFEALGWNVYNRSKRNDSISAEETISKKRVDYGFRIKGIPKFFLEAKSMKEDNIQTNPKYVTQAIDYAWMKSCSWAILANFETIAVYNADWKESNYGNNLFFVLHPSDFLTDKRFTYFSKIAFENNELDKLASKYGKKQLKNPINKQLLQDMIHFREVLSKDVVRNNQDKHLSQDDIDEAVQRILDRLIFIRNAEDRGLEENQLQSIVRQWRDKGKGHLVKEISKIYRYYDDKYNSKLFAHHLCDGLYIENEALQEVIEGLNQSKDNSYRYDFSIIESDVLGNIYEQYLGNILKSTPKRAKLEESKTHRKEQGIYYTPFYIVDYIVKNTVGEFIKTHTPEEIRRVRILDPACGSGSFLIRAYKELENYWKQNSDFAQLTLDSEEFYSKRVEILRNNIFGVDLDPKAVEIAQLNLLLQISEKKQRLPLLQNNIKVGNSLIDEHSISDKAFKWEEEFQEIMKEGGFDIVIGNPPYVRIQNLGDKETDYFSNNFQSAFRNYDIYLLFVEKSLKLLRENGDVGFIIPSKFVNADYGLGLRNVISESKTLHRFVDFKDIQIFGDATNYTCLLFLKNAENSNFEYLSPKSKDDFSVIEISNNEIFQKYSLPIPTQNESWILSDNKVSSLMKKLKGVGESLGEISKNIFQGLVTGEDSTYFVRVVSETKETAKIMNIKDNMEFVVEKAILKKLLKGKDIRKWNLDWKGFYVVYPYLVENGKASLIPLSEIKEKFPLAYRYFKNYEENLKSREEHRFQNDENWHKFGRLQNIEKFEQPKIITQVLASNNTFAIDLKGEYYFVGGGNAGGYGIVLKDSNQKVYHFVLALLNSNVLEFYLKNISTPFRGGYFSYGKRFIDKLPLLIPKDSRFDLVSSLSEEQVKISKKMQNLHNTDERYLLERELYKINQELNQLIYQVYGLSKSEITLLENQLCR
jgi:type II restriction/modification system DNA methylase subunit YeeA